MPSQARRGGRATRLGLGRRRAGAPATGLRRELGFWGTASLSVAGMAPTLAMSVTGVQPAGLIGRAAPLAYVLAAVGIALIAYGFIRLSAAYSHAGSVYTYVGRTLGPQPGFLAGWALIGTYIVFPPVSVLGMAIFGQAFLQTTGIAAEPDWLPLALVSWVAIWLLASRGIRLTTGFLLAVEGVSLLLISALIVVIFAKLGIGGGPRGQGLNLHVVDIPDGTTFSTIALAGTFGFLSFGGFESAMSLGEESRSPRRMIPRSIAAAVAFGGVFYVICVTAQTLGFGTDAAGIGAFAASGAPLGELANDYVGSTMAALLDLGALLSALGAGLAGVAVASRTLFAFGRDGIFARRLSDVSPGTGTPAAALAASMLSTLVLLLVFGAAGTRAIDAFFYLATIGVLILLVLYMLTSVASLRLLFLRGGSRARWEAVVPLAGIAVSAYVLYRNLVPVPAYPFNLFPYIAGAWLVTGLVVAVVARRLAERIDAQMALPSSSEA